MVALAAGPAAAATWKWRDASGQLVYSDLPPPPGVRITALIAIDHGVPADMSSPNGRGQQVASPSDGAAVATAQSATPPLPGASRNGASARSAPASPSGTDPASAQGTGIADVGSKTASGNWVEREKAARQQAATRAEAERAQADEKRRAADNDRACADAAASLRTLDSGLRVATVNARGAPEVIDQLERARRTESTRRMLAENCGARG